MKDIAKIFLKAVESVFQNEHGAQKELAIKSGLDTSYLNRILNGKTPGSDNTRRKIAAALGYEGRKYEDFLEIGRCLLDGLEAPKPAETSKGLVIIPKGIPAEELDDYNFLRIPFRDDMRLFAGSGGAVPGSIDSSGSPVVIHRSSIQLRADPKDLVAFRVGGDSMEPLLAKNGIVAVDTSQSDLRRLKDGAIYALTWDREEECAVKRLRWAIPKKLLAVESTDPAANPTLYLDPEGRDVFLIGRVVWSWREH